jgi:putative transposase
MTKEGFEELQSRYSLSGLNLMTFLRQESISYSNYRYWRSKYVLPAETPLAPVRLTDRSIPPSPSDGVTLLLPNGIRAHFGIGSEDAAMSFLSKSLQAYVLPE